MTASLFHIVLTIWIGIHPVTYTLPKLYYATDVDLCVGTAEKLAARLSTGTLRKDTRVEAACEPTNQREL